MSVLKDIINKAVETAAKETLSAVRTNYILKKLRSGSPLDGVLAVHEIEFLKKKYPKLDTLEERFATYVRLNLAKLSKSISIKENTAKEVKTPTPAAAFTKSLSNIKKLLSETESARVRSVIAKGTLKSQTAYKKQIIEIEKQLRTILADLT